MPREEIVPVQNNARKNPDILKSREFLEMVDYVWGLVREEAIVADATKGS